MGLIKYKPVHFFRKDEVVPILLQKGDAHS